MMSDEDIKIRQQNNVSGTQNIVIGDQLNAARDQYIFNSPFVQAPAEVARAVTQHQPGSSRQLVGRKNELAQQSAADLAWRPEVPENAQE